MERKGNFPLRWPNNRNLVMTVLCYGCGRERLAAPTEEVCPTCCNRTMGADAAPSSEGWWDPYGKTYKPKTQENRDAKNAR